MTDLRQRIEAAIKDAYYSARDNGGTMHTAATDATDAVLAVLAAPDEETVERLARVLADATAERAKLVVSFDDDEKPSSRWEIDGEDNIIKGIRAVLAALADTPVQAGARRAADEATGGGEDG